MQILEAKQKSVPSDIRSKALKIKGEPAIVNREELVETVLEQLEPRLATLASSQTISQRNRAQTKAMVRRKILHLSIAGNAKQLLN